MNFMVNAVPIRVSNSEFTLSNPVYPYVWDSVPESGCSGKRFLSPRVIRKMGVIRAASSSWYPFA